MFGILFPRMMSESWDFEMPDYFAKSRIERFCSVRSKSIRVAIFLIIVGVYRSIILFFLSIFHSEIRLQAVRNEKSVR